MFLFFQDFYNFIVFLVLSDSIAFVISLIFIELIFFTDLINLYKYYTFCYYCFYIFFYLFYFSYTFLTFFMFFLFLFFFITAEPLSGAVASPSTLKAGIASSPLFSLLDLSWSVMLRDTRFARFVIAYFLTQLCHTVALRFLVCCPSSGPVRSGSRFRSKTSVS